MWWIPIALSNAWGAACPDDPVAVASAQSDLVLDAYDRADGEALVEVAVHVDFAIDCLDEILPVRVAVEIHRAKALIAYYDGEDAAVVSSWAAVRVLDPLVSPDPERWPPDHAMWTLYEESAAVRRDQISVRGPIGGWRVDGEARTDVPGSRAFLLQGLDREGVVIFSGYLYSVAEVPQLDWAELEPTAREGRRKRVHTVGTVVAGALGAAAAASFGFAEVSRRGLDDVEYENIDAQALRANTSASLAIGLGAGAVTTAVATWTIRW